MFVGSLGKMVPDNPTRTGSGHLYPERILNLLQIQISILKFEQEKTLWRVKCNIEKAESQISSCFGSASDALPSFAQF